MSPFFVHTLLIEALAVGIYMSVLFVISVFLKRNDIADAGWGIGFIVTSVVGLFASGVLVWIKPLVIVLVGIWGIRLATHIIVRLMHHPEDKRYALWRQEWGNYFYVRSYLQIYLLQGVLMWIVLLPTTAIISSSDIPKTVVSVILGVFVWMFGFIFESIGDTQLVRFLAQPENKGKLMTGGLWKYTRHPNYFGEVTQWWGIWVISLAVAPWYVSILGPLVITSLILFVSGIPMTERGYVGREDFEAYKKKTSVFVPWFPKN